MKARKTFVEPVLQEELSVARGTQTCALTSGQADC